MTMQLGFFIDTQKCTGCKTCTLACKDYKDIGVDRYFRRVYEYAGGDWISNGDAWSPSDVFAYYISISCNHCSDPACVKVCPSGAMHKRDDNGLVIVNEDVCIGCRHCENACPYGAPQYNHEKGHMTKCDGCHDRIKAGLETICVGSCPLRAIEFGDISELRAKHGNNANVAPLPSSHYTNPNLVVKLSSKCKPVGDKTGFLANPREV